MLLDHTKASVTISFSGLSLSCVNKKMNNRYEFGILGCEGHNPVFDIQEVWLDPKTMLPTSSKLVAHSLDLEDDIEIDVSHPEESGVTRYINGHFDRPKDEGNREDFRWVVDLEGKEFHNKPLKLKDPSRLKPLIFIKSGELYSEMITDESIALVPVNHKSKIKPLGKVAFRIGLDIRCRHMEDSVVILRNKSNPDNSITLLDRLNEDPPKKYLVTIENLCYPKKRVEGTDFLLFYDVVQDPVEKEKKFDLQRVVDVGDQEDLETTLPDRNDLSLDTPPQNCLPSFLGQTNSLQKTGTE